MFIHNNFLSLHCKDNINELIEEQMKKTLLLLCLSIFVINACEDDIELINNFYEIKIFKVYQAQKH